MPLIQWIMQNLVENASIVGTGGAYASGSSNVVTVYNVTSLGGVLVGGESIVVIGHKSPVSMVDFIGGLADIGYPYQYPSDFAF